MCEGNARSNSGGGVFGGKEVETNVGLRYGEFLGSWSIIGEDKGGFISHMIVLSFRWEKLQNHRKL
jgi:hypothetical protein